MKTRRGFTLIEALVSMAVIAILAALGYMGVDEYVTSAKATKIIMNLHTVKKALWEWYADNKDKVQSDGRVKIGNDTKPIQEWQRSDKERAAFNFAVYLKRLGASGIKFETSYIETITNEETGATTKRQNTDLSVGYYGICDYGTRIHADNSKTVDRNTWYVGYRFTKNEDAVREKIRGRLKSAGGIWLGTADAHPVPETSTNPEEAVWLKVR
ncbi:MAG: prepilin-type N-terminal cleavage/methylation domain-containing protein [Synergistaceae bacterium]|nr:prepilin-type N-terminal cleavage/methylation domain-containing protein [Synergistaceae bacterium]